MSATTDLVDAMNDDLSPNEEVNEEVTDTTEESKDTNDTGTDEEKTEDDDDGYVIDDETEDETKEEPAKQTAVEKPTNLTAEQQFIYDGLPTLSVIGKDGTVRNVKVPNELPNDFEFASSREQANFFAAVASQELKANNLQQKFQSDANQKSADEFATREDRAITDDIANLQKTGDLPKFKKQPSDPDFDSDPTAKQVDEIVQFMQKKNAEYLKRNQAGQAYRHIGFEEAFYLYRRENPEKTRSVEQKAEDAQRKEVTRNVSAKGSPANAAKRTPINARSTRDLYAFIDGMDD